jgi:transcriptional regulator with XRE-family HTH domain
MQLVSKERLRSFVGPEPEKKMSGRRLARAIDVHTSFIDHLMSGRRTSCKPVTAQRIAEALDVPLDILFVPSTASVAIPVGKEKIPA